MALTDFAKTYKNFTLAGNSTTLIFPQSNKLANGGAIGTASDAGRDMRVHRITVYYTGTTAAETRVRIEDSSSGLVYQVVVPAYTVIAGTAPPIIDINDIRGAFGFELGGRVTVDVGAANLVVVVSLEFL